MHDYYLIKSLPDGTRRFWNHKDKLWDRYVNDSLYTLPKAKYQAKILQKETVFPVSILHFSEVK